MESGTVITFCLMLQEALVLMQKRNIKNMTESKYEQNEEDRWFYKGMIAAQDEIKLILLNTVEQEQDKQDKVCEDYWQNLQENVKYLHGGQYRDLNFDDEGEKN